MFRCRFTEDAIILDLGGLQLTILWRCWPVLNGSFAMSLISTVGTHGGGAASYLYSFCAVYVCWSLALMSDGPTAAKAFGSASPRPLGVAWDTRHKAFKVFLSTQCKAESLGCCFSWGRPLFGGCRGDGGGPLRTLSVFSLTGLVR